MNWFNRSIMIEELEKGKSPIEVSIKKWSVIYNLVKDGKIKDAVDTEDSDGNCACCYVYRKGLDCSKCPIHQFILEKERDCTMDFCGCSRTPYTDIWGNLKVLRGLFKEDQEKWYTRYEKVIKSIKAELDLLFAVRDKFLKGEG